MSEPEEPTLQIFVCPPGRCKCLCPDGPCEHVWDGPWVGDEMGESVTCSRCAAVRMSHDMAVGP